MCAGAGGRVGRASEKPLGGGVPCLIAGTGGAPKRGEQLGEAAEVHVGILGEVRTIHAELRGVISA